MIRLYTALIALGIAASGCGDSTPAPAGNKPKPSAQKPAAGGAAATAEAVQKAPIALTVAYEYKPLNKRDPFRSPDGFKKDGKGGGTDETIACKEPLCQWDLDQLSLVAVVTGDSNPIAMLEDPKGQGH